MKESKRKGKKVKADEIEKSKDNDTNTVEEEVNKPNKKARKLLKRKALLASKSKAKEAGQESAGGQTKKRKLELEPNGNSGKTDNNGSNEAKKKKNKNTENSENNRFIVFMGNLPYRTSPDEVKEFLAENEIEVKGVRLPTERNTNKPKGFAFVEFNSAEMLQSALQLHHTQFKGRAVNFELTVGGGGSSQKRKSKLADKNKSINKYREKKAAGGGRSKKKVESKEETVTEHEGDVW